MARPWDARRRDMEGASMKVKKVKNIVKKAEKKIAKLRPKGKKSSDKKKQ